MPKANQMDFPHIDSSMLTPERRHQIVRQAHAEQARVIRFFIRATIRKLRRGTAPSMSTIRTLALRFAAACNRLAHSYAERWKRRSAMAALNGLSDGALKDIGVCRSEIAWAARHGRIDRPTRIVGMPHPRLLASPKIAAESAALPPPRKRAA